MSEQREFELLTDIARLLRKYGPDAFEELARYVEKPDFIDHLAAIFNAFARVGRKKIPYAIGVSRETHGRSGVQKLLRELEENEPAKYQVLSIFYNDLLVKNVFPSLREIKAFALDNGLVLPKATSRDKAILPLLKALSHLPTEEIKAILERTLMRAKGGDRTLEGWAGVILKERRSDDKT
jgi:hypothetical protein